MHELFHRADFMMSLKMVIFLAATSCVYQITKASEAIGTGGPSLVMEGKDALLTCVVTQPYLNNTVLWRKGSKEIMSAGMNRVTQDTRIRVLHDENPKAKTGSGGDVWVLLIKNTKPSDTDIYACEVNSDPVIRSFQSLTVRSLVKGQKSEKEDENSTQIAQTDINPITQQLSHDFTDCCESKNVSKECIGFCNVHNIIDGTTGVEPEVCEKDFPVIVKCMADGRNHIPCCEQKGIPDICQDMCRGEYTPFTDLLRTRVSCIQHTLPGLQCILEGVQKLPSSPTDVYAETTTDTSLEIGWSPPEKLAETVTYYSINVSALHNFDPDILPANKQTPAINIKVSSDLEKYVVNELKPLTMYSVTVTAHNEHGESLPSQRVRALTFRTDDSRIMNNSTVVVPQLPNIRGCCEKNGMYHRMCLDKMCDPKKASLATLPDFMVCAPWSNVTFNCLANDIDHTSCCRTRGIPSVCLPLCSGKVSVLNFSLFKCLRYMPDLSSCLLHGYGVLPGYPTRLRGIEVSSTFTILDWSAPKIRAETVSQYTLFYRKLGVESDYAMIQKDRPPLILEDLEPGTYYECYVTALNAHGRGLPSSRLVFRTKFMENIEQSSSSYNITKCCQSSQLNPQCLPLCSYNMKLSDMQTLGAVCQTQMAIIVKCAVGGRDHVPCCNRRGVSPMCAPLCRGVLPTASSHLTSSECLSFAGNILQCFEEGTENIPGPVEDMRAIEVTDSTISLEWSPPTESLENTTTTYEYIVQYGKVSNMTMYETVFKLENEIHTNATSLKLSSLETSSLYRILVIVSGEHGTSLPSSMLVINTTSSNELNNSKGTFGVPSPPHSLQVSSHSADWVTISWQPPEFSHPHESISYRVYHKATLSSGFSIKSTRNLWTRLDNLRPNSQHIVYVEAIGEKGVSLASETLVAWTDPALPAFVETPTVQPSDIIAEGGSMTVLCLALGNPAPTISLYVGGHLVRQDKSRNMVTVIHNVTADMEHVSCYADNGYGMPMQATRKINISYPPRVQASGITVAGIGESVDLKCAVRSIPNPKTMFWRDKDGRIPIMQGGNYDISFKSNASNPSQSTMILHILNLQASDVGDYFCHAENALGSATSPVSVRIRSAPSVNNITECCSNQNVSSSCMIACGFYVDIDAVINKPECIVDFNKLMRCAADGSDHRKCCADSNVPRKCLNWCRGESVLNAELCSLQYTRTIVGCFESNRDKLPGPPQNLAVNVVSDNEVKISWDPPSKNPDSVDGYRIFYHEAAVSETVDQAINSTEVKRIDVIDTNVKIDGLKPEILYELVVKAGNKFGASILTVPVRFTIGDIESKSASDASTAGTISGIIAGTFAIILAALGLFFYKRRRTLDKAASAVAFENPSYLRGVEQVQIATTQTNVTSPSSTVTKQTQSKTGSSSKKLPISEVSKNRFVTAVQAIGSTNPPHYEELKFGQEGL
ncbi:Ig-like and fibronectin type-III domain-containing protein 2 [Episyrphus balteatus]|uniref:Ig-like and fibronectin type-III domain-containing protein 2 n=1 Tax=Episyrphus balteatus TaxID=286459 RepID=UPI002485BC30|nr:Ig-like and fibronectin type-III domain-containing protein 2 [Episyrphus balteatus]